MTRLSYICLFSTGPKLDNYCPKKDLLLVQAPSLLAESWLHFWSHSLLQTDFSSDYTGRIRNDLISCRVYTSLFLNMNTKLLKSRIICCVKHQFLCAKVQSILVPPQFVCSGDGTATNYQVSTTSSKILDIWFHLLGTIIKNFTFFQQNE